MFNTEGDFMGIGTDFMDTGMSSNVPVEMAKGPGRPERPFPLRPGSVFPGMFYSGGSGGFPMNDETDLIFLDNISHSSLPDYDAFAIMNALNFGASCACGG